LKRDKTGNGRAADTGAARAATEYAYCAARHQQLKPGAAKGYYSTAVLLVLQFANGAKEPAFFRLKRRMAGQGGARLGAARQGMAWQGKARKQRRMGRRP
jgi:hypothetical protein